MSQTEECPAKALAGQGSQGAEPNCGLDAGVEGKVPEQLIGFYQTRRNQLFWGRLPSRLGAELVCIRGCKAGERVSLTEAELERYYDAVSEEVARGS